MEDKKSSCIDCKFYFEGDCRRFPPQVWGETLSEYSCSYRCNFPEVGKNDWCGEFRSKDEVVWVVKHEPINDDVIATLIGNKPGPGEIILESD